MVSSGVRLFLVLVSTVIFTIFPNHLIKLSLGGCVPVCFPVFDLFPCITKKRQMTLGNWLVSFNKPE